MLWRSNQDKTGNAEGSENRIEKQNDDEVKREKLIDGSDDARKMYEDIQSLRNSVNTLVDSEQSGEVSDDAATSQEEPSVENEKSYVSDTEAIKAARRAIVEQAKRDAIEDRKRRKAALEKARSLKRQERELIEAQRRAEKVRREAEKKRLEAQRAEKRARDVAMKHALEEAEAERRKRERVQAEKTLREEMHQKLGESMDDINARVEDAGFAKEVMMAELEQTKEELISQRERLRNEQENSEGKIDLKKEKERLKRARKLAAEERARANKQRRAKRRADKKAEEADRKAALEKQKEMEAELGAGIVEVKGVEIKTELTPVPEFSWKELFGFKKREERKASDSEELKALRRERWEKQEEAKAAAALLAEHKRIKFEQSLFGRTTRKVGAYCEKHKKALLITFAVIITCGVTAAGVLNYYTAYEYSYNGKELGLVKEKDTVLRVIDLVRGALTEDKNMNVVIDADDDITFKRVRTSGDAETDSSDEVLKRLTYMGDINVKAYGIYVDGKKVGAVESENVAAQVLEDIKEKYSADYEESTIEEAVIVESVDVKKSNTPLDKVSSEKEMVDILCTSGEKETLHTVVAGETFADIAKLYSLSEEELLEENEGVDPRKLEVGSTIKIKQTAPILTVKITEVVTYEEKIKHKTKKRKSKKIYKGEKEVKQKGKNGVTEITSRIVSVNGEQIEETNLETTVKKEPVTEVVLVGTKKKPSTVGSGDFIWPAKSGYTLTSNFGSRWGRTHEGIDLGCSTGTDVLASDGGTVTVAGYSGAYGYLVEIDHQNGMVTRYGHNSSVLVDVGDKVYQGQHIAESGSTGRSTGPHIHFEIRVDGVAKDPLSYLP